MIVMVPCGLIAMRPSESFMKTQLNFMDPFPPQMTATQPVPALKRVVPSVSAWARTA